MKDGLCVRCEVYPASVKKYGWCGLCYQKAYRNGEIAANACKPSVSVPTEKKERTNRELDFIKNFFTHANWIHHPGILRMNGISYAPDFYDGERNMFIEVAGTRQAYSLNKEKYSMMAKYFPKILFEVRKHTGELIDTSGRINW